MGYGRHTPTKTGIMEDRMSRRSGGGEVLHGSFGLGLLMVFALLREHWLDSFGLALENSNGGPSRISML